MSGHSRWSQIKHKKAVNDAKKGNMFGKIARAISVAARDNPDPATNLRLKAEIDRAHALNMPGDNIERAIRRVNEKDASALSEIQLEFIGPGSAAIIVQAITDNSNRTISELKQIAVSMGARPVGQGSLLWMFRRTGPEWVASSPVPITDENRDRLTAFLDALDEHDDVQHIVTNASLP